MPSVLCLITDGFEEVETITPVDFLRRAEVEVTVAAMGDSIHVTGRNNITIHADLPIAMVTDLEAFDLLLIPGGPMVAALRSDGRAAALAKKYHDSGKPVAAICAAPTVLKDAGLLQGTQFTCHNGVRSELADAITDQTVVEDNNIITSQGAGTSIDFALALVRRIAGPEVEARVRTGVML